MRRSPDAVVVSLNPGSDKKYEVWVSPNITLCLFPTIFLVHTDKTTPKTLESQGPARGDKPVNQWNLGTIHVTSRGRATFPQTSHIHILDKLQNIFNGLLGVGKIYSCQ